MISELLVRPLPGIGEVRPGDDLAALIVAAAPDLADGDVLVVTSKIVSKAEGRLVEVPPDGPQRETARAEVLAGETARVVASRGPTRIVQTHHGLVMAAAGVDASNVDRSTLVLLPIDPDRSARQLRNAIRQRYGRNVAVVISDTMGRPWRLGLVDVAIGAAGIDPLRDHRGERDMHGNDLVITQMAVIDELAAVAELVKGKLDQLPVAVIRGYPHLSDVDGPGARSLVRPAEQDLFSLGTAEARADGLRLAATLPDATAFADVPIDSAAVTLALSDVDHDMRRIDRIVVDKLADHLPPHTREVVTVGQVTADPRSLARAGAAIQRLRSALAAVGLASAWIDPPPAVAEIIGPAPVGLVAIGAGPPDQR